MADILESYLNEIKNSFGANLKAAILYGSKASGEDSKDNSDHNLLVILEKIDYAQMAGLAPATKRWIKEGNPPPHIFTCEEFLGSTDVFPIEFLDMKETHKLFYGEDFLSELNINRTHLRHECEYNLRSNLLKLRQSYIALNGKPREIRALLIDSISAFLVLFKHAAGLLGEQIPAKKIDSLPILSQKIGLKTNSFMNIYNMKHGDKAPLKLEPEKLIEEYMTEIEKVIKVVDGLN
jgi:predicted nucleotidyltransferase